MVPQIPQWDVLREWEVGKQNLLDEMGVFQFAGVSSSQECATKFQHVAQAQDSCRQHPLKAKLLRRTALGLPCQANSKTSTNVVVT